MVYAKRLHHEQTLKAEQEASRAAARKAAPGDDDADAEAKDRMKAEDVAGGAPMKTEELSPRCAEAPLLPVMPTPSAELAAAAEDFEYPALGDDDDGHYHDQHNHSHSHDDDGFGTGVADHGDGDLASGQTTPTGRRPRARVGSGSKSITRERRWSTTHIATPEDPSSCKRLHRKPSPETLRRLLEALPGTPNPFASRPPHPSMSPSPFRRRNRGSRATTRSPAGSPSKAAPVFSLAQDDEDACERYNTHDGADEEPAERTMGDSPNAFSVFQPLSWLKLW
jgi:hypothetical protein